MKAIATIPQLNYYVLALNKEEIEKQAKPLRLKIEKSVPNKCFAYERVSSTRAMRKEIARGAREKKKDGTADVLVVIKDDLSELYFASKKTLSFLYEAWAPVDIEETEIKSFGELPRLPKIQIKPIDENDIEADAYAHRGKVPSDSMA